MNSKKIYLSVIIPAYNEAENYHKGCLNEVLDYLKKQKYSWEVILVDDGSFDETSRLIKSFSKKHKGFRFYQISHAGKLAAISTGVFHAKGEIILFSDFDQSVSLCEIEKIFPYFVKKVDIVIASRYEKGAKRLNDSLISWLRSIVFNILTRLIVIRGFKDTQCGFKAFRQEIAQELFPSLIVHRVKEIKKPYMGAFDVELLFLAKKRNLKVVSVPVSWRRYKSEKLTLEEPIKMFWSLLKIRLFDLIGFYR